MSPLNKHRSCKFHLRRSFKKPQGGALLAALFSRFPQIGVCVWVCGYVCGCVSVCVWGGWLIPDVTSNHTLPVNFPCARLCKSEKWLLSFCVPQRAWHPVIRQRRRRCEGGSFSHGSEHHALLAGSVPEGRHYKLQERLLMWNLLFRFQNPGAVGSEDGICLARFILAALKYLVCFASWRNP